MRRGSWNGCVSHGMIWTLDMGRCFADLQPYAVVVRYPLELSLAAGDEDLAFTAASLIAERMELILVASRD
ncbi:MAG: hypothetical protein ACOYM2_12720 [Rectinemataceae bacterium]